MHFWYIRLHLDAILHKWNFERLIYCCCLSQPNKVNSTINFTFKQKCDGNENDSENLKRFTNINRKDVHSAHFYVNLKPIFARIAQQIHRGSRRFHSKAPE